MALHAQDRQDAAYNALPPQNHAEPPEPGHVAREPLPVVHGAQHGIRDAEARVQRPAEDVAGERGVVACIVVDEGDAVFVEAVVEFFVDGVEIDDCGIGEAERELEEEVVVAENGFVDVEGLLGCAGSVRWRGVR